MPHLLDAAHRAAEQSPTCAKITTTVSQSASDLAAQSLANMWRRLFQSYVHFTQPGCDSFVDDAAGRSSDAGNMLEALWRAGFETTAAPDALVVHLFVANEHFDTVAWVIAFCLVDRLQLTHYVHQRLHKLSFWSAREESRRATLRLAREHVTQLLFTAYTLAFKWHLDYTVSVKYLTNLLPHTRYTRKQILRHTIQQELTVLDALQFNCAVSAQHMLQLMDHFLTASERGYVLHVVHRG